MPIHAPVVSQDHCFFVDEDDPLLIAAWAPGRTFSASEPWGSERYRMGLHLRGGDSLSLGEHGELYYQDGGILTSVQ